MKNSKIGNRFFIQSYLQYSIMQFLYVGKKVCLQDLYNSVSGRYNFFFRYNVFAIEFMFVLKELKILGYIELMDLKNDISLLNLEDGNCQITKAGFKAYKKQLFQNQAANIFNGWRSYNLSVLIVILSVLAIIISIIALFSNS